MKFGYRDRIVLLVACVIIIFGIGIVVFIKPKYEALQKDKKSRDQLKTDWGIELDKFAGIENKQKKLEGDYEKGKKAAAQFTDSKDAVGLDNFLRETFMNTDEYVEDGVRLLGTLSVSDETTEGLSYYYYTPSIVTYPLYELADMDGSLQKAISEKRAESDLLSTRAGQTVGAGTAGFTIKVNRKDAMALIDAIHDYAVKNNDAMILHSVGFSDYKFKGGIDEEEEEKKKQQQAANPTPATETEEEEDEGGTSDMTLSYSVYYMQEPTKPDVGPTYDPSVWDTDAWKTFTAAEQTAE